VEGELLLQPAASVTDDGRIGPYRIVRRVEMNGTSETMLAVSEGPDGFERTVVIKRLLPHAHSDPKMARSLGREATAYARLTHPAILRLYDYFAVNGEPAMVLEFVDGVSLARLVEVLRERGEKLPVAAVMYIGERIFAALTAAHSARDPRTREFSPVIHRDVSPTNVLVTAEGEVKLSNFGFAKLIGMSTDTSVITTQGPAMAYAAPEQLLGLRVTVRTDVYAGALVLRELLTGKEAFPRGSRPYVDYLQEIAKPALAPLDEACPDLPASLRAIMQRALEPDADQRDVTAASMQRALGAHRDGGRTKLAEVMARLELVAHEEVDAGDRETELPSDPATVAATQRFDRADVLMASSLARGGDPSIPCHEEMVDLPPQTLHETSQAAAQEEHVSESEPHRRSISTLPAMFRVRARRWRTASALVGVAAALVALLAADSRPRRSLASASARTLAPPAIAAPPPFAAPVTSPAPAPPPAADEAVAVFVPPPTHGELRTLPSMPPHRVFVDGRAIGESGAVVNLPCGTHAVRIGAGGKLQSVNVPCGGAIEVATR
jgi:serine/threonine protein kinase